MDGNSPLGRFAQSLRSLWNYSGTLAALALFAGVLAMGVAHLTRNSAGIEEEARFFRGGAEHPGSGTAARRGGNLERGSGLIASIR